MNYKKICKICDCDFTSTGPAAKYCEVCLSVVVKDNKKKAAKKTAIYRLQKGLVKKPGVGSGNNQSIGKDHVSFKHGRFIIERLRKEIKLEMKNCERCSINLEEATHYQWVVHHKDHNHYNNLRTNLEFLCKRCHQLEHECHKAFVKGATTNCTLK